MIEQELQPIIKKYNKLSLVSYILIIIGVIALPVTIIPCFGAIIWIAGLITGIISHLQIRSKKDIYKGHWMSVVSIIIAVVVLLISLPWQLFASFWVWTCMQNPGSPC
jgi:hypothetical protein